MGLANSGTILLKDENMPPPGEFFAEIWKVFFIFGLLESDVFIPLIVKS